MTNAMKNNLHEVMKKNEADMKANTLEIYKRDKALGLPKILSTEDENGKKQLIYIYPDGTEIIK